MSSRFDANKCVPSPDEELICTICHDVLDTPLVTPCQHIFCQVCITRTTEMNGPVCPTCRDDFGSTTKLKKPMPLILNMLNKLTIKCDNEDKGCTDLIPLENYLTHQKSCPFTINYCERCNKRMLTKDLSHHAIHQCPQREVSCEKCGLAFPWALKGNHECLKSLVYSIKELTLKNDVLELKLSEQDARLLKQEKEIRDLKEVVKGLKNLSQNNCNNQNEIFVLPDTLPE